MSPEPTSPLAARIRERGEPLLEALAQHAPQAHEHAEASAIYGFALAVELGFDRERCEAVRELARLHEVGRVYVAAAVLAKPAAERSEQEAADFATHFEAGARLARGAGIPESACESLLQQRESFDGSGPDGLAGEQISLEARLLRVVCVCQTAMTAPGSGGPHLRAIVALGSRAGGELDPDVVAPMIAVLERAGGGS